MCVDFTNLNLVCPTKPYPFLNIYRLVYGSLGYKNLSFMDAYFGYNHIKMDPLNTPKIAFVPNNYNYYYEVMPFDLKNTCATYHRIMNVVF